jgi:hypothetical protein
VGVYTFYEHLGSFLSYQNLRNTAPYKWGRPWSWDPIRHSQGQATVHLALKSTRSLPSTVSGHHKDLPDWFHRLIRNRKELYYLLQKVRFTLDDSEVPHWWFLNLCFSRAWVWSCGILWAWPKQTAFNTCYIVWIWNVIHRLMNWGPGCQWIGFWGLVPEGCDFMKKLIHWWIYNLMALLGSGREYELGPSWRK